MVYNKRYTKLIVDCDCGSSDCVHGRTCALILFFDIQDQGYDRADEIEELLKDRYVEPRAIPVRLDKMVEFAHGVLQIVDLLDSMAKRSKVEDAVIEKMLKIFEVEEWPEELDPDLAAKLRQAEAEERISWKEAKPELEEPE